MPLTGTREGNGRSRKAESRIPIRPGMDVQPSPATQSHPGKWGLVETPAPITIPGLSISDLGFRAGGLPPRGPQSNLSHGAIRLAGFPAGSRGKRGNLIHINALVDLFRRKPE